MFRTNVNSLLRLGVAVIIVMFGSMTQVANADQFVEDFEEPLDFLADGVGSSGWDGFLGLGADETADALNASVTNAGQLYMESTEGRYDGGTPLGPYLYKIVEGDFIASVHVADYQDVLHNSANLMARNVNDEDAGAGDDWVSIDYFPIWSCGNFVRSCDDGARTENGHNGLQFDLDPYMQLERVGNTFHFRTSVDGVSWTEMAQSPLVRDDFDGLPMQVGLCQATFSGDSGYAVFDDFILEGENVESKSGEGSSKPSPDDSATDVLRDSNLSWKPGEYAVTHNLYVGESFEDVNDATVPTASDLDVTSFNPGSLEFDQVYYWRVDEVNGTPDKTVFKGDVWSFTVEPYSIQIPGDGIVASASSVQGTSGPENTINGSGFDPNTGTHNTTSTDMWFSLSPDMSPWLQYEFDDVKLLDKLVLWNSNSPAELAIGWGLKDVQIEYSVDGTEWTPLPDVAPLNRATGLPTYDTPDEVPFGNVPAKFVKISMLSNHGGLLPAYSVSEVQFFEIPVKARTPYPADQATDVMPNVVATWRAGHEAEVHQVLVSQDANAISEGLSAISNTNSIDMATLNLQLGETYYWQVVEVNENNDPSEWASDVWTLTTVNSVMVDDFESYGNLSPDRPFQTWLDGFGYSADEFFPVMYPGNGTGAGIGHDIWSLSSPHFGGPIMETDITIAGSRNSMPFYFNGASETERELAMDFTLAGVKTLSIPFHGQAGNTGSLYAKINGVKIPYTRDAANLAKGVWQAFNIDLSSVNTDLANVTKLAIGVEGNASGMILIDDITLQAEVGQVITPVDPGNNGMVALYTFEGNMNDSSGNNRHGTVVGAGGTQVVSDPERGQVLSLPGGSDQYVEVGAVGISGTMPRTIACWAKAANTDITDWTLIFGFTGQADESGGNGSHFNIGSLGGPGGIGAHCWGWEETMVSDDEGLNWHHYAMTYDGTTIAYFVDGVKMDSDENKSNVQDLSASADRVHIGSRITQTSSFPGNVDDAVIYDRVLSAEEILFLADVTSPVDALF